MISVKSFTVTKLVVEDDEGNSILLNALDGSEYFVKGDNFILRGWKFSYAVINGGEILLFFSGFYDGLESTIGFPINEIDIVRIHNA